MPSQKQNLIKKAIQKLSVTPDIYHVPSKADIAYTISILETLLELTILE